MILYDHTLNMSSLKIFQSGAIGQLDKYGSAKRQVLEWDVCNSQSCHLFVLLTMADKFYVKREQVFHSRVHFHLLFVWAQNERPRHVHSGYLTYFPKLTKPRKLDKIRSTETVQPAYPCNKGERISEFVNCSEEWGNISVCPLIAQEVLVAVWSHQPLQMNTRLLFVSGSPTAHVVPATINHD